jgi:hypothetical protein
MGNSARMVPSRVVEIKGIQTIKTSGSGCMAQKMEDG